MRYNAIYDIAYLTSPTTPGLTLVFFLLNKTLKTISIQVWTGMNPLPVSDLVNDVKSTVKLMDKCIYNI